MWALPLASAITYVARGTQIGQKLQDLNDIELPHLEGRVIFVTSVMRFTVGEQKSIVQVSQFSFSWGIFCHLRACHDFHDSHPFLYLILSVMLFMIPHCFYPYYYLSLRCPHSFLYATMTFFLILSPLYLLSFILSFQAMR